MEKQTTPEICKGCIREGNPKIFLDASSRCEISDVQKCPKDKCIHDVKTTESILKQLVEKQEELIRIYSDVIIPDGKLYKEIETLKAKLK